MNWLRRPAPNEDVVARVRYRSRPTSVARVSEDGGGALVELERPVDSVAPGQALVLYAAVDGEVLGGGTITAPPC